MTRQGGDHETTRTDDSRTRPRTGAGHGAGGGRRARGGGRADDAAWDAAFNSQDAAGLTELYAEDARVVTGDGTVKDGRAEIEALFRSFMESGSHDHEIAMLSAERSGNGIYETGTWEGTGGDGAIYGGHLVNIYERQDNGSWKTVLHFWN